MQLSPQTHEGTLATGAAADSAMAPTEGRVSARARAGVPGGVVGGMVGGVPEAPPPPPPAPAPMMAREAAMDVVAKTEAAAQGRDMGDLFEYRLKEPVTIRKNQSALVPIVNGAGRRRACVGVERVDGAAAARRGVGHQLDPEHARRRQLRGARGRHVHR